MRIFPLRLSVSLDLSRAKTEALAQIDRYFNAKVSQLSGVPVIHALKLAKAQAHLASPNSTPDPQLVAEAGAKGIELDTLCITILRKAVAMDAAIMTFEIARQAAKSQVAAAVSQQVINLVEKAHQ